METQVTKWVKTPSEIQFAVNQIEKYGDKAAIREECKGGVKSYAVFRAN